jgi:hypothetical protein
MMGMMEIRMQEIGGFLAPASSCAHGACDHISKTTLHLFAQALVARKHQFDVPC